VGLLLSRSVESVLDLDVHQCIRGAPIKCRRTTKKRLDLVLILCDNKGIDKTKHNKQRRYSEVSEELSNGKNKLLALDRANSNTQ
jgi:hypothetical protein